MLTLTSVHFRTALSACMICWLSLASAHASETVIHRFTANYLTGKNPVGQMAVYNGYFYGVTRYGISGSGNIFRLSSAGVVTNLHEFNRADGAEPTSGLTLVSGFLYGTTSHGGTNDLGVIYRISTNGTGFQVLHSFTGAIGIANYASDGSFPYAKLTYAADGRLYGVTMNGGYWDTGTVFYLNPAGSATGYGIIHSFYGAADGGNPTMGLGQGPQGFLYGIAIVTGGHAIYRVSTDGNLYGIVHVFPPDTSDPAGSGPESDLIEGSDGRIYGTCAAGGTFNDGTVFALDTSTGGVAPVWNFDQVTGAYPERESDTQNALLAGSDGNLYGRTIAGGAHNAGTLFRLTTVGTLTVVANLTAQQPWVNPVAQSGTSFYFTTYYGGIFASSTGSVSGYGAAWAISSTGNIRILYSFYQMDGYAPSGPVREVFLSPVRSAFFGEAAGGQYGDGILYVVNSRGGYSILHHVNDALLEGKNPRGGLLLARDGKLYGVCREGGKYGYGTLFRMSKQGAYTVIHHFQYSEGGNPYCALTQGVSPDDNLYGTLRAADGSNGGTFLRIDTAGKYPLVLHAFSGLDGVDPQCTPLPDGFGNFYGTCVSAGPSSCGSVWLASGSSTSFGVVAGFSGPNGAFPYINESMVLLSTSITSRTLFGATSQGGDFGQGAIFGVNTVRAGAFAVHSFYDAFDGYGRGCTPSGGVIYDPNTANFYGCCSSGGLQGDISFGDGTIYSYNRITGAYTVLHAFSGTAHGDGASPLDAPTLGSDGLLYGVTSVGGIQGNGIVYKQTTTP